MSKMLSPPPADCKSANGWQYWDSGSRKAQEGTGPAKNTLEDPPHISSEHFYTLQHSIIIMIVAEFSMVPMGSGTSAGDYIKAVHDLLKENGVTFIPGPMSTAVQANSLQDLFELVEKANHRLVQMGVQRIIISIRIDMRLDREISLESKLSRLEAGQQ